MKRKLTQTAIISLIILLLGGNSLLAQEADTVTVTGTGTNGNIMPGDLYKFINSDTLANGLRSNPNRFYRLERGKVYVVSGTMFFRYNVNLIADDDNPNSPTRPPMIVNGKLADGSNNQTPIALMKNNTSFLFKNIFFQGVTTDKREEDDNNAISIGGDSIRLTVDKCVFNALGANCIIMWSKGNKFFIKNNHFRNLVRANPFKGQLIVNSGNLFQDSIQITNNTSFNNNSYFWGSITAVIKYERIEHNTLFSSVVNVFYSPWMVNSEVKSNLFYGMLAYGQKQTEIDGGWYDFNKSLSSIISLNRSSAYQIGLHGFTEKGRKVTVSNNNYFWPQAIKDNWSAQSLIASDLWMNTRTAGYFADKTNYPYLSESNNVSVNPGFNAAMEKTVMDSLVFWVNNMRNNNRSTYRNYNVGSTNLLFPTWPLPENLAYTNTQLMTAGHDGLPVGDLNWFPTAKAQWEAMQSTTPNALANPHEQGNLNLSNYPNPVIEQTTFKFNLSKSAKTSLKIITLDGKQVATIVNSKLNAGTHTFQYDASNLKQGVYICQLISGNYVAKSKLIITK